MAKFWKFLPSFAFSTSMLYSSSREMLNSTRNYTEGERLQAMYKMEDLPERNNITLESFALENMGGDALALSIQCIVCIVLVIAIETGLFLKLSQKLSKCDGKKKQIAVKEEA